MNRRDASIRNVPKWREKAARAMERNGRPGEAVAALPRACRNESERCGATGCALARASFLDQITVAPAERNWHEFREAFKKAVRNEGERHRPLHARGRLCGGRGKFDQSVSVLEKALARAPKAWELWQAMAIMQERRKADAEVKKAVAGFEKSAAEPRNGRRCSTSRLAMEAGRLDESRTILVSSLASLSDKGKALVNTQLVELDLRKGNRADARRRLEESAASDPDNLQTLDTLAQFLADDRDWKALEDIETRLKKIEGDDGTLWRAVPRAASPGRIDRAGRSAVPRGRAPRARNRRSPADLAAALRPARRARPQEEPTG